MVENLI